MSDEPLSISDAARAFGIPVSTLRYYDDIGLVRASHRRSRVRHYDRDALARLAYTQLWHLDGMLSIEHTSSIVSSLDRAQRNDLLERCRRELADRIERLREAHEILVHASRCTHDDHNTCPVIRAYLDHRVDAALDQLARGRSAAREPARPVFERVKADLFEPAGSGPTETARSAPSGPDPAT